MARVDLEKDLSILAGDPGPKRRLKIFKPQIKPGHLWCPLAFHLEISICLFDYLQILPFGL